jgi:hypothetical protein
MSFLSSETI